MIGRRRGRALLVGAAVLAVLLVAGRWLAVETAERAWAASLPNGAIYLEARALAQLTQLAIWLVATLWGTGNLYIVYRAIGSVQMPRRVGNLEIVEAVPQRLLLVLAVASGLIFGIGLAWGTGEWWRGALLAGAAPRFGVTDPVLHRDLGYYVGELPWALERQGFLLLATLTAAVLVATLYVGIGSLRWQGGRVVASPHARAHVGVLLAGMASALLWGALLDPAEVVAGLHGTIDAGAVAVRIPGAAAVAGAAALAGIVSLAWAGWDHPRWLAAGWGLLLLAMLGVYGILPSLLRGGVGAETYARERAQLRELALGTARNPLGATPEFPTVERFVASAPLWNSARVAAVARPRLNAHETVAGVTLARAADGAPLWIVARAPDDTALTTVQPPPSWEQVHRGAWAATRPPVGLVETDTGLIPTTLAVQDSLTWFGAGFTQYAVRSATPGPSPGVSLAGVWRRVALAWVLQSPEIFRRTAPGDRLLWRRGAGERFTRLAPFAEFDPPQPVITDGALWWLALGYVSAETFPLVEPVLAPRGPVRYLRAGLVAAVRATSGEPRFWLLPEADSLSVAWARLFAPLVAPAESLPPALAAAMRFPARTFSHALGEVLAAAPDSEPWRAAPRESYEIAAPQGDSVWLVQGFTSGQATRFEGFLLGRVGPAGPELRAVSPPVLDRPPQLLVGMGDTLPGPQRLWVAAGHLASSQARFIEHARDPPRLERVYLTWGTRTGDGPTRTAALRDLLLAGPPGAVDTSLGARWEQARRLFVQLDSALQQRDFDRFGRVYRQLSELLGTRRRALAPATPPH
ncbi:MAG: UPF0182 family protein [Gemmatimonadales bacterium]